MPRTQKRAPTLGELLEEAAIYLNGDELESVSDARSCIDQALQLVKQHPHCPDNRGEAWFDKHTPEED